MTRPVVSPVKQNEQRPPLIAGRHDSDLVKTSPDQLTGDRVRDNPRPKGAREATVRGVDLALDDQGNRAGDEDHEEDEPTSP